MSIPNYLSEIYSEELFNHSEDDERAMAELIASEQDGWQGYGEWSATLEAPPAASENFVVVNGKLQHKPEPKSLGRLNGFEL
jgi:hypothetical protein